MDELEGKSVAGERFVEFYPEEDSILKVVVERFYERKE
jgi:hypothetical protein